MDSWDEMATEMPTEKATEMATEKSYGKKATEKTTEKYGNGYGCIWTHARNLAMGTLGSMHKIQGFSTKANNPLISKA